MHVYIYIHIYLIFSLFYFNLVIIFIWNIILILFAFSHMEHFYNLIEMNICFPLLFITFNLNLWTLFKRPAWPFSSHFMIWFHALSSFSAQFCRLSKDLQTHFSHVLLFSVILNGATNPVISTSLLHFSLNFYVFPWSYFLMHEELIPAFLLYQCLLWMADFAFFLLLLKSFQNFPYNIFMYTSQVVLHLFWLFVQCQWYKLVLEKRHRHYFFQYWFCLLLFYFQSSSYGQLSTLSCSVCTWYFRNSQYFLTGFFSSIFSSIKYYLFKSVLLLLHFLLNFPHCLFFTNFIFFGKFVTLVLFPKRS